MLCSDACAGREAGSPEGARARDYIVGELRSLGLESTLQPVPGCRGTNAIARVNPGLGRAVLVGAHYDHLGRERGGEAYWGADDNAAAVGLLIEVARSLTRTPPKPTTSPGWIWKLTPSTARISP